MRIDWSLSVRLNEEGMLTIKAIDHRLVADGFMGGWLPDEPPGFIVTRLANSG
jgi:hypothetical protein